MFETPSIHSRQRSQIYIFVFLLHVHVLTSSVLFHKRLGREIERESCCLLGVSVYKNGFVPSISGLINHKHSELNKLLPTLPIKVLINLTLSQTLSQSPKATTTSQQRCLLLTSNPLPPPPPHQKPHHHGPPQRVPQPRPPQLRQPRPRPPIKLALLNPPRRATLPQKTNPPTAAPRRGKVRNSRLSTNFSPRQTRQRSWRSGI